jgi:GxxExxY protein
MICEFRRRQINIESEKQLSICYKDELIGKRRVDFLIDKKVLVEIKLTSVLDNNHLAQAINYLEVFNLDVGMLINSGASSLEYKRVVCSKLFAKNKEKNS